MTIGPCRVGIIAQRFGESSGHPFLASEAKVLYAGEIELDSEQVTIVTAQIK